MNYSKQYKKGNRALFSKKRRIKHKAEKQEKIILLEIASSFYRQPDFKTLYSNNKKKSLKQIENFVNFASGIDREITREIAFIQNL